MVTILGMGNPLLDISDVVDGSLLEKYGLESNNAILAEEKHLPLYAELAARPDAKYIAGGATQNSIRVAQWMLQQPGATAYMGCVGDDDYARRMQDACVADGVQVLYMVDKTLPTGTCAVCITGNDRSLVANLSAANNYKAVHLQEAPNWAVLQSAKVVYSAGFFATVSPEAMELASSEVAKQGGIYCLNLSAPFLMQAPPFKACFDKVMPLVDILFGNETEAKTWAEVEGWDTQDVGSIATRLSLIPSAKARHRYVVITQGADPTLVAHKGSVSSYPIIKLPKEKIVDTNGAGDAYVGGFLAALSRGLDIEFCHEAGAYAASEIIRQSGCTFAGPPNFMLGVPGGTTLRVFNDAFRVASYDGGCEDPRYGIEHVLQPSLKLFHCSGKGTGWTLDLETSSAVLVTHFAVHGPAKCTEPIKGGQVWLSNGGPPPADTAPTLVFETDAATKEWSGGLKEPTLATFVRVKLDSTHGKGDNIDIAMIALVGVPAADLPPPDCCLRPIPQSLKVTDLKTLKRRQNWLPLESNPRVFNKYLEKLGFDSRMEFHELLGMEKWAFDMVPKPVHGLVFLFPITEKTEEARKAEAAADVRPFGPAPDGVIHMKQLIGNACGTIALLHIMCNMRKLGSATFQTGSWLERFMAAYKPGMTSADIGGMLEEDVAIAEAHREAEAESEAKRSRATPNLHFIAFVNIDGKVVELDGRKHAPFVCGEAGSDFLAATVEAIQERYVALAPGCLHFSTLALCGGEVSDEVALPAAGVGGAVVSEDAVAQLVEMGFAADAARTALEAMGGSVEGAMSMLLG